MALAESGAHHTICGIPASGDIKNRLVKDLTRVFAELPKFCDKLRASVNGVDTRAQLGDGVGIDGGAKAFLNGEMKNMGRASHMVNISAISDMHLVLEK